MKHAGKETVVQSLGHKKALCVGVNAFQHYPSATLQGCVNDAKDMAALLKEQLGFSDSDIIILADAQATKANIMQNLVSMVKEAKAGKHRYLVFSFSGHGTLAPDMSGDEPDRADDAFCSYDLAQRGNTWDPQHLILDDELQDLFAQLPRDVVMEVFLDTCHSGAGLKANDMLLDRKPRYLPPPSLEGYMTVDGRRSRGVMRGMLEKGLVNRPLWLGCRVDQTSADALIGGAWHGAFTYFFCKEMRACRNALSRLEILRKVTADLKAGAYSQIPQLQGDPTLRKSRMS